LELGLCLAIDSRGRTPICLQSGANPGKHEQKRKCAGTDFSGRKGPIMAEPTDSNR
jgi:hypothetical protein